MGKKDTKDAKDNHGLTDAQGLFSDDVLDNDDDNIMEFEALEGETKAEKFERIGKRRYRVAVQRIRLLGNLGNRSLYEYDDDTVTVMFDALRAELDKAEAEFRPKNEEIFDPFA